MANVAVEAVEIEGSKIFVAGSAPAGSTIRIYANETLLGETKATATTGFCWKRAATWPSAIISSMPTRSARTASWSPA